MSSDTRQLLHDAAPVPTNTPDFDELWKRGRRQRRVGQALVTTAAVTLAVVAVAVLPGLATGQRTPGLEVVAQPSDAGPVRMRVEPEVAAPGDIVHLYFPQEDLRGLAFTLERQADDGWELEFYLASSPNRLPGDARGPLTAPDYWRPDEERGVDRLGITGPGPDRVIIPPEARFGRYRICTANAKEQLCAELELAESPEHVLRIRKLEEEAERLREELRAGKAACQVTMSSSVRGVTGTFPSAEDAARSAASELPAGGSLFELSRADRFVRFGWVTSRGLEFTINTREDAEGWLVGAYEQCATSTSNEPGSDTPEDPSLYQAVIWPERDPEAAARIDRDGASSEPWRRDPLELVAVFLRSVAEWHGPELTVVEETDTFTTVRAEREPGGPAIDVYVAQPGEGGLWWVTGAPGARHDREGRPVEGGLGVSVRGTEAQAAYSPDRDVFGAARVEVAFVYEDMQAVATAEPDGTAEVTLPEPPTRPGYLLIRFFDEQGQVDNLLLTGLPAGNFAAG